MCPEIKHSQSGLEKSSVLGLEVLASAPETVFQNFLLQGAVGGGPGALETGMGQGRVLKYNFVFQQHDLDRLCKENPPASSY